MNNYKTIFQGWLEFGSHRSYNKVLEMFEQRAENFYRFDILFKQEDVFSEDQKSILFPKYIKEGTEKSWKNTVSLLEFIAQFAVAGNVSTWVTNSGTIVRQNFIEPKSDRQAVQAYQEGKKLTTEGKEDEAVDALNRAIEKYARHAQAYERRGYIKTLLGNYQEAFSDFSKSISFAPLNPEAYLGRAKVNMIWDNYEDAIPDLERVIKNTIPHQSIFWVARRYKAECFIHLDQPKGALLDLKLFNNRDFDNENPNYDWKKYMSYLYGTALLETEKYEEALKVFENALTLDKGNGKITDADILFQRSLALKKLGRKGFVGALKEAAHAGSTKAAEMLTEVE